MKRYSQSKKKIRGWKRRVREIERWKKAAMNVDSQSLERNQRIYVKFWSSSFYSLDRYKLPKWYKQLVVQALADIYFSWKQTIEEMGTPYYLKIWLFDHSFMQSQVVASIGEALSFYEKTFELSKNREKWIISYNLNEAADLSWETGFLPSSWTEEEFREGLLNGWYTAKEIKEIKKSVYKIEKSESTTIYWIKEDTVWLGSETRRN